MDCSVTPASPRCFWCARCNAQVLLCTACDRGNQYCIACADLAGRSARKQAACRYQQSYCGRRKHAARQARYRQRCKEKVTHQAPPEAQGLLDCEQTVWTGLADASGGADPLVPAVSGNVREPDDTFALPRAPPEPPPADSAQAPVSTPFDGFDCARCGCRVSAHFRRDFVRRRPVKGARRGVVRPPSRLGHDALPRHT